MRRINFGSLFILALLLMWILWRIGYRLGWASLLFDVLGWVVLAGWLIWRIVVLVRMKYRKRMEQFMIVALGGGSGLMLTSLIILIDNHWMWKPLYTWFIALGVLFLGAGFLFRALFRKECRRIYALNEERSRQRRHEKALAR